MSDHAYIYINGYPGVGKLTIARELAKLIPNSRVFDSNLLINPVDAMCDRSAPYYDQLCKDLRMFLLGMLTDRCGDATTFIFTDARSTHGRYCNPAPIYFQAEASNKEEEVPFVSVVLECDLEENIERLISAERVLGYKKLTDCCALKEIREKEDIYHFDEDFELVLNVTHLSPKMAAKKILEHTVKVAQRFYEGEEEPTAT
ncbi:hypothetical protein CONLIGDRAFT_585074 [Coniochaeta ligniaria NRRL 30616]|uniref:P-loop containing nucleoside triphosphate hydrolase protein n=1 Tax=Coniochaeta ligniaria NRRL 30616 TaxID=1408157 RepID=A0A1J7I956_9PEZI|nr:hypothetical protein CONLIGDRAFT_585074 [Coniochaeta ligniaria NRRL 30616]